MKILLIDDSKTMRNIQKSVLKQLGYTIKNGEVTYEEGEPTGALPGNLIRGPQPAPQA